MRTNLEASLSALLNRMYICWYSTSLFTALNSCKLKYCKANYGELARRACSRMPQLSPTFSKASCASKLFMFLAAFLLKVKEPKPSPISLLYSMNCWHPPAKRGQISCVSLPCNLKAMVSYITFENMSKAFSFEVHVLLTSEAVEATHKAKLSTSG